MRSLRRELSFCRYIENIGRMVVHPYYWRLGSAARSFALG